MIIEAMIFEISSASFNNLFSFSFSSNKIVSLIKHIQYFVSFADLRAML